MPEVLTQERELVEEQSKLEQLVAFLRAHPFRFDYSRHELAERFDLSEEFVSDVIETLKGSPHTIRTGEAIKKAAGSFFGTIGTSLRNFYFELTERPWLAIPVTTLVAIALMLSLRTLATNGLLPIPGEQLPSAMMSLMSLIIGTVCVLHALIYFRHGMLRFAAFGAGTVFVVSSVLLISVNGNRPIVLSADQTIPAAEANVTLVLISLIIAAFYFSFATVPSLAGGFYRTNRADVAEKRLTRQQLIDRLFQLQGQLKEIVVRGESKRSQSLAETLRTTPWLPIYSIGFGLFVGAFTVVMRGAIGGPNMSGTEQDLGAQSFVNYAYQFVMTLSYVALGYFSGGIRRSIVALTLFFATTVCVELVPVYNFGPQYFEYITQSGALLEGLAGTLLLALFVGVGAHIDKRARVRQKLKENDPAFVVAEIIEIQWRLNPVAGSSCVVVVDVAGSTRMKSDADPLAVEYSFRAFHDFLAGIGSRRGGTVVSTAGDASVLTFQSCPEALYFAKEVQTEIERFNSITNRLDSPFRLRIGIHTGNISAQLSDVPFNEVIDIAAHVEKEAPVGGIAITQPVADILKDERVAELKEQVDDQHVYVVLNPILVS